MGRKETSKFLAEKGGSFSLWGRGGKKGGGTVVLGSLKKKKKKKKNRGIQVRGEELHKDRLSTLVLPGRGGGHSLEEEKKTGDSCEFIKSGLLKKKREKKGGEKAAPIDKGGGGGGGGTGTPLARG